MIKGGNDMIYASNRALTFDAWLDLGLLFALVAFVVCYIVYALVVRKVLCQHRLIVLTEKQTDTIRKNNKLLVKTLAIALAIAFVLGIGIIVWNNYGWDIAMKTHTFYKCDAFKAFMEADYEKWYKEGYSYVNENGDAVVHVPLIPDTEIIFPDEDKNETDHYPNKVYKEIKNAKGEVICEYYHNPDLYEDIRFTESADDKMPVTVITMQASYDAKDTYQTVTSALCALIVIDFISAAVVYIVFSQKQKNKS